MIFRITVALLMAVPRRESTMEFRVISADNGTSAFAQQADRIQLTCSTSKQWFFCLWSSPSSVLQCAIQYEQPMMKVCKENPRIQLIGDMNRCDIQIQVAAEDHGRWMCLVNDIENFDATKNFVDLNVGMEASVQASVEGESSPGSIVLTEGDQIDISCTAFHGFPRPSIVWFGPTRPENQNSLTVIQNRVTRDPDAHTASAVQLVRYTAQLEDDNKTLGCTVLQEQGGVTYYTKTISHRLTVDKRPPVEEGPLTQSVSFLSGILFLHLFLLLSCILLVALLVRQRAKKKRIREIQGEPDAGLSTPLCRGGKEISEPFSDLCATRNPPLRQQYNEYKNILSDCNGQPIPHLRQQKINSYVNSATALSPPHFQPNNSASATSFEVEIIYNNNNDDDEDVSKGRRFVKRSGAAAVPRRPLAKESPAAVASEEANGSDEMSVARVEGGQERLQWPCEKCEAVRHPLHRSLSTSDLSLSYSAEDLTKSCRLLTGHGIQLLPPEVSRGSEPHLFQHSIPSRTLVNPTHFPATQSLASLHTTKSKRKRRKTAPAFKSSQSVFDCEEGCFLVESTNRSQQIVAITTGPVIL